MRDAPEPLGAHLPRASAEASAVLEPEPDGATPEDFERVTGEVAELSARVAAVKFRLLERVRELDGLFERFGGSTGARSTAHWLAWRTGLDPTTARERVRVARALGDLPRIGEAMRQGRLSYSKVRALTRIARPETQEKLLDFALRSTGSQLEQLARAWRRVDRLEEAEAERMRHESRHLTLRVEKHGGVRVTGLLDPEVGALLKKALEIASQKLLETAEPGEDASAEAGASGEGASAEAKGAADGSRSRRRIPADPSLKEGAAQRRADAVAVVAQAALQAGLRIGEEGDGAASAEAGADVSDDASAEAPVASAASASAEASSGARSRDVARTDRYQVVLHVDLDALQADGGARGASEAGEAEAGARAGDGARSSLPRLPARGPGPGWVPGTAILEGVGRISPETARRISCDSGLVAMSHGGGGCEGCGGEGVGAMGEPLNVGRKTRTVPPALRRALEERDRCCRFPGCELRHCQSHHVVHWVDGGKTKLENMILLCPAHHWAVHEGGFSIELERDGTARFRDPGGWLILEAPEMPPVGEGVLDEVREEQRREGLQMDEWTPTPLWEGEPFDLHYAISVLWEPPPEDGGEGASRDQPAATGRDRAGPLPGVRGAS